MGDINWQQEMAQAITNPVELLELLRLPSTLLPAAQKATSKFGLRVPRSFVALMEQGNPFDPLLRQVLPVAEEMLEVAGFQLDPVGDCAAVKVPGVLAKYYGRVLLIASPVCAVHCRYCVRRNFPYNSQCIVGDNWQPALASICENADIREVILSGGDPLALGDNQLEELITELAAISHIQRLRIHTRLPVLIPQRITPQLLNLLRSTRLTSVVVLHINHPQELGSLAMAVLQRLRQATVLLNQSVLLRGVNDDIKILTKLSEQLFANGIIPYYIHLIDRVHGAAHLEVAESVAKILLESMRQRLPGYLVPRLVREEPGAKAKTVIM